MFCISSIYQSLFSFVPWKSLWICLLNVFQLYTQCHQGWSIYHGQENGTEALLLYLPVSVNCSSSPIWKKKMFENRLKMQSKRSIVLIGNNLRLLIVGILLKSNYLKRRFAIFYRFGKTHKIQIAVFRCFIKYAIGISEEISTFSKIMNRIFVRSNRMYAWVRLHILKLKFLLCGSNSFL